MNIKRFIFAALATFFFTFITDFLVHAVWLEPVYKAESMVRPEAEQMERFPWMIVGHLLLAVTFPLLWAKFGRGGVASGAMFGFLIGLLVHAGRFFFMSRCRLRAGSLPVGSLPA
jgi:hypothetical protein